MPPTPADTAPERRKPDAVAWQRILAGALTALLLAGGGYLWLAQRDSRQSQTVTIAMSSLTEPKVRPAPAVPAPLPEPPLRTPEPEPQPRKAVPAMTIEKSHNIIKPKIIEKVPPEPSIAHHAPEPVPAQQPSPIQPEPTREPPKVVITPHTVVPDPALQAPAPQPQKYSGPSSGDMAWSVQVAKGEVIEIQGARPSSGILNGQPFPGGIPVSVSISSDRFAVISQPNPLNQFSKISFRSEMNGRIVLTIHWQVLH